MPTIAFSNDHAGPTLKKALIEYAESLGHTTLNLGPDFEESVDYPDQVNAVVDAIQTSKADFGVLICGSGIGISIAANRHAGIRAALCATPEMVELGRQHNDANILCLGARLTDIDTAKACLKTFLETAFEGGERHVRRVKKLG